MGFIGYQLRREGEAESVVRIFLECQEDFGGRTAGVVDVRPDLRDDVSYTYAVDVVFPGGHLPCRFRGVDGVLVLKKFYKLVHSLEERARERGKDPRQALESAENLVEHLTWTRNVRDFTGRQEPVRRRRVALLA